MSNPMDVGLDDTWVDFRQAGEGHVNLRTSDEASWGFGGVLTRIFPVTLQTNTRIIGYYRDLQGLRSPTAVFLILLFLLMLLYVVIDVVSSPGGSSDARARFPQTGAEIGS